MKGSFFSKPLEWSIETAGETWQQGAAVQGKLKIKNHGPEAADLSHATVGLAYAEIKKVHARSELVSEVQQELDLAALQPGQEKEVDFNLRLPENCPVSDKKASYFLTYGSDGGKNHLQLKIEPKALFSKIIGLLDTFQRFKVKDLKGTKKGVEYKLIPPTSREMAGVEGLVLGMAMKEENLQLNFEFQVKKLDTSSVTTKVNKASLKIKRELTPKEYSLGKDMINQDALLQVLENVLDEVKMKNVF